MAYVLIKLVKKLVPEREGRRMKTSGLPQVGECIVAPDQKVYRVKEVARYASPPGVRPSGQVAAVLGVKYTQ